MVDDFRQIESESKYDNDWYTAGYDLMRQPDGLKKKYYWVDISNAVTIVPILDDSVVMIREYRPVTGRTYVSCPTGVVEGNESYVKTADRELTEETHYNSSNLTHIQSLDVATGVLKHERGVVVAQNLSKVDTNEELGEDNEYIEVVKVPKDEIVSEIRKSPSNSASIEAILLAKEDQYL